MTQSEVNTRIDEIAAAARDYKVVVECRIGKLAEATAQCTAIALELKTWGENIRDSAERIERRQKHDEDRWRIWHAKYMEALSDHERRLKKIESKNGKNGNGKRVT
jgi:hypothetical protein